MTNQKHLIRQEDFLNRIKDIIPENRSLVDELSDILNISTDSIYRRLRGKTALSFEETIRLCNHYNISLDSFNSSLTGAITFNYTRLSNEEFDFDNYLESTLFAIHLVRKAKEKHVIYAGKDMPIFHNFKYPELSALKMFYWMKSIMNVPMLEKMKFDTLLITNRQKDLGLQILENYSAIPSTEIWTDNTVQSTVKQIEYYWESGVFLDKDDALLVCDQLSQLIHDIQLQAENSSKFLNHPGANEEENFTFYYSDIELGSNCVLVTMGDLKAVYLGHHTFNTMSTTNPSYCAETEQWLRNIMKKSTLISGVSEKIRYQFFKKVLDIIDELRLKIKG